MYFDLVECIPRDEPTYGPDVFKTAQEFRGDLLGEGLFDPAWVTEYYDEWMECEGKCDADQYRKITFWWLERGNTLYIFPPVCARDFVRYMDSISG